MRTTDVLKEFYKENPEALFEKLSMDCNDRGLYYNGVCPCHLGDNETAFSWLKEMGTWKCWTHSCEEEYGNDAFGLVRSVLDMGFKEAKRFLEEGSDVDYTDKAIEAIANKKFCNKTIREQPKESEHIPESMIKKLVWNEKVESYMVGERGFTREAMGFFEIGCAETNGAWYGRMVIPIRDEDGVLAALTSRRLDSNEDYIKWLHFGNPNDYLFNYHNAKQYIAETQKVFLVEGPLGVIRLWEAGIMNAVAIFGVNIGPQQRKLLLESGAFTVCLLLDNDEAGREAMDRIADGTKITKQNRGDYIGDFFYTKKIILKGHSDVDEMTTEQIGVLLEDYI